MSHIISVEIDAEVARKTLELLERDGPQTNPNAKAWVIALREAIENDDA